MSSNINISMNWDIIIALYDEEIERIYYNNIINRYEIHKSKFSIMKMINRQGIIITNIKLTHHSILTL